MGGRGGRVKLGRAFFFGAGVGFFSAVRVCLLARVLFEDVSGSAPPSQAEIETTRKIKTLMLSRLIYCKNGDKVKLENINGGRGAGENVKNLGLSVGDDL